MINRKGLSLRMLLEEEGDDDLFSDDDTSTKDDAPSDEEPEADAAADAEEDAEEEEVEVSAEDEVSLKKPLEAQVDAVLVLCVDTTASTRSTLR